MAQDDNGVEQVQRNDGCLRYPEQAAALIARPRGHDEQHPVPQRGDAADRIRHEQRSQKRRGHAANRRRKLRATLQVRHDVAREEQVDGHHSHVVGEGARHHERVLALVQRRRGRPRRDIPKAMTAFARQMPAKQRPTSSRRPRAAMSAWTTHHRAQKRAVPVKRYVEEIERIHGRILSLLCASRPQSRPDDASPAKNQGSAHE